MNIHRGQTQTEPLTLILGVERCGSTWVANIFDSSPDVEFFMEPFADFAKIFPGFPDRLFYISGNTPFLEDVLTQGLSNMNRYKYPFPDRRGANSFRHAISHLLIHMNDKLIRLIGGASNLKKIRYNLLNLHQSEMGFSSYPEKEISGINVIKELRLNFKIGLLHAFYPDAKYIVVIRNPLSQVASIYKLFSKNSLYQLKQSLYTLIESVETCDRFRKYKDVFAKIDRKSIYDRLIVYWFLNYNVLIEDLKEFGCDYILIKHEDLCENPYSLTEKMFSFAGCRYTNSTKDYILKSSEADNSASSPLDTTRRSKKYYIDAIKNVDKEVKKTFLNTAEMFWDLSIKEIQTYKQFIKNYE